MSEKLRNKKAIVTGGEGGIGTAICQRFRDEGAEVISADLSACNDWEKGVEFRALDVTSEEQIKSLYSELNDHWGQVDILVNAAGIEIEKTIEETTLEEWNRIFAINVTGTFLMSKYALPLLRKSSDASVINFGSYDGFIADPKLAAYCATKGAIHALTRAMACDHGPDGIRVNAICPGFVDTPMLKQFLDDGPDHIDMRQKAIEAHPLRTIGTPEDMANLVNWLASDEARYASGQLWVLDGALSAQIQQTPRT